MSTREPKSTVELLTYAAAWFDDLDDLAATFARVTGRPFTVDRTIQADLLALARWMAEHSDASDDAFGYVQRNGANRQADPYEAKAEAARREWEEGR